MIHLFNSIHTVLIAYETWGSSNASSSQFDWVLLWRTTSNLLLQVLWSCYHLSSVQMLLFFRVWGLGAWVGDLWTRPSPSTPTFSFLHSHFLPATVDLLSHPWGPQTRPWCNTTGPGRRGVAMTCRRAYTLFIFIISKLHMLYEFQNHS